MAAPVGFLLVVSVCLVLLAALAALMLSWLRDAAESARATADATRRIAELLQAQAFAAQVPPLDEAA